MKKNILIALILAMCINSYSNEKKIVKNSVKVSFYDKKNNITYSHDDILKYNCTKMKPIKIMQGFFIDDTTDVVIKKKTNKKTK